MYTGYNQQRSVTDSVRTDLGISKTTVSEILMQDLGVKCVVRLLLPEQKEHHVAVANDFIPKRILQSVLKSERDTGKTV